MRGYLCDGGCGGFFTEPPAATYEHRALLVDEEEERKIPRTAILTAELCEPCAIRVSAALKLYETHEALNGPLRRPE